MAKLVITWLEIAMASTEGTPLRAKIPKVLARRVLSEVHTKVSIMGILAKRMCTRIRNFGFLSARINITTAMVVNGATSYSQSRRKSLTAIIMRVWMGNAGSMHEKTTTIRGTRESSM